MSDLCGERTVAENMLERGEIEFIKGNVLTVSRSTDNEDHHKSPAEAAQDDVPPRTIQLSDIPAGTKKDTLIMFLENKRKCGGGTIKHIEYDDSALTAIVTFEDQHSNKRCISVCVTCRILT